MSSADKSSGLGEGTLLSHLMELRNRLLKMVITVLVLFVFLRDFRSTLIIGLAIPVSIVATFILMLTRGVSLNVMSLGGLALTGHRAAHHVSGGGVRHRVAGDTPTGDQEVLDPLRHGDAQGHLEIAACGRQDQQAIPIQLHLDT